MHALLKYADREFDPDQPRDDDGKWTSTGGGGSTKVDVGTDRWNKDVDAKLRQQYQDAKPMSLVAQEKSCA